MFPGFKSTSQLKWTPQGLSLYMPVGTAASRNTLPFNETAANNITIGSGIMAGDATSQGNVFLGIIDNQFNAPTTLPTLTVFGSQNIICAPAVGGTSSPNNTIGTASTHSSGNVVLVPGNALNGGVLCAGTGNVIIGTGAYTAATGGSGAVVLGNGAAVTGNSGVAIGSNTSTAGTSGVAIGSGSVSAGGVAIGSSANAGSTSISIGPSGQTGTGYGNIILGQVAPNLSTNTNQYITMIGGTNVTPSVASGVHNATQMGVGASIDQCGSFNYSYGGFGGINGNAQLSFLIGRTQTTSTSPVEIGFSASSTNTDMRALVPTAFIILQNNTSYLFECHITAQVSGGTSDSASWMVNFMVSRGAAAANTALVGTPSGTTAPLFATTGATSGAWAVAVTADTTNGRPAIKVTGAASTTINWVMSARVTKVGG